MRRKSSDGWTKRYAAFGNGPESKSTASQLHLRSTSQAVRVPPKQRNKTTQVQVPACVWNKTRPTTWAIHMWTEEQPWRLLSKLQALRHGVFAIPFRHAIFLCGDATAHDKMLCSQTWHQCRPTRLLPKPFCVRPAAVTAVGYKLHRACGPTSKAFQIGLPSHSTYAKKVSACT